MNVYEYVLRYIFFIVYNVSDEKFINDILIYNECIWLCIEYKL